MVEVKTRSYQGYEVVEVSNAMISLMVTVSTGPRIISLSAFGKDNLFAELPDAVLEYSGEGDLALIGGHRLWYAPEDPATTYIPDSKPVGWRQTQNGVELIQEMDEPTRVQKGISIQLSDDEAKITVTHILTYHGNDTFTLAPWAITQLKPGGKAVIPQKTDHADRYGLLPNRNIVLWPYTDLDSPNIWLENWGIYVIANMEEGALKIGSPNPMGWIGYALDDLLFIKRADFVEGGNYLDRGASSQIYCNPDFIELETLGPVVTLSNGDQASHIEEWGVYQNGQWPAEFQKFLGSS
ncbi:MAG: hypothetical protein JW757_02875 [Anaerolineales bacterium]|nr:hypothetical protein [Anaerolineales bacterium]